MPCKLFKLFHMIPAEFVMLGSCWQMELVSNVLRNCTTCTDNATYLYCAVGFVIGNGTCTVLDGLIWILSSFHNRKLLKMSLNCANWSSLLTFLTCFEGCVLTNGSCDVMPPNISGYSPNCKHCSNSSFCYMCYTGFFNVNGTSIVCHSLSWSLLKILRFDNLCGLYQCW